MLDALGLPEQLGDMIGAQIDAARGDWAGYARNMMDLTSGMSSGQLDGLFGKGLPGSQFVPRPHEMLSGNRLKWGGLFHTPFGRFDVSREQLGGKGLFGKMVGTSMERAILTNPAFKARMERVLGGRIIPDGRPDGRITVLRYRPNFPQIPFTNQIASNPMLSGMYGALARMENNIKNLLGGLTGGASAAGSTAKAGGSSAISQTTNGVDLQDAETKELAQGMGMDTSALSFEDVLFLMMMKYARKKEKEIISKMNELSGSKGSEGSRRRRGYGGFIGGLLGGVGKLFGTFGGLLPPPYGMIAKVGGGLMNMAGNAASGGSQGSSGAFGDANQTSDTLKQMQMQKLMEDLKKMYEMLSNVMKSMTDMQMAAVRNLR
ncbi:MAG: hypothetical protein JXR83_06145 [Deltaproteobacteria bacterium]|nr:hypothetical protein [Deltaproteobacteria bacterium]